MVKKKILNPLNKVLNGERRNVMKPISENTHFHTDLKTLAMIIGAIAIAVWTYSEINNRIISLETAKELINQLYGPVPDDKGRLPDHPHHGHNH